ncbi:MAG: hypothetical protein WBX15_00650 [Thermoanaerobaculia bacterium]
MSEHGRITLVHAGKNPSRDWIRLALSQHIIPVDNIRILPEALEAGINELGKDIERVVFDRSGSSRRFLEFLSKLPLLFRGDVLFIQRDGSAYLSAILSREGRILYFLEKQDVEFYLKVHFDLSPEEEPEVSYQDFGHRLVAVS